MSSAGDSHKGAKARSEQSAVPDVRAHLEYCRIAEECGLESLLIAFGFHRPEPIALAAALGVLTSKIKFMVACRSGICSPTYFVQQVNTVSCLTGGRICINMVAGHTPEEQQYYGDFLQHDDRYRRNDEFLTVCRAFWRERVNVNFAGEYYRIVNGRVNVPFMSPERSEPEIFLGGASSQALEVAARHASCLLTLPDTPERLRARTSRVRDEGREVGLLVSMIARPTRGDAIEAGRRMIEGLGAKPRIVHRDFVRKSDSVAFTSVLKMAERGENEWLTSYLWTGAVPHLGAPSIAIAGSFDDVADAIFEYRDAGVTQFLFMGWPDTEEMSIFGREILPRVRRREAVESASCDAQGAAR